MFLVLIILRRRRRRRYPALRCGVLSKDSFDRLDAFPTFVAKCSSGQDSEFFSIHCLSFSYILTNHIIAIEAIVYVNNVVSLLLDG